MSLTCPWSSSSLLVSFSLSKLTTCLIQVSPDASESGWMQARGGTGESAFPATIHLELWYTYLRGQEGRGQRASHTQFKCCRNALEWLNTLMIYLFIFYLYQSSFAVEHRVINEKHSDSVIRNCWTLNKITAGGFQGIKPSSYRVSHIPKLKMLQKALSGNTSKNELVILLYIS